RDGALRRPVEQLAGGGVEADMERLAGPGREAGRGDGAQLLLGGGLGDPERLGAEVLGRGARERAGGGAGRRAGGPGVRGGRGRADVAGGRRIGPATKVGVPPPPSISPWKKFIGGAPTKPATNSVAGRL